MDHWFYDIDTISSGGESQGLIVRLDQDKYGLLHHQYSLGEYRFKSCIGGGWGAKYDGAKRLLSGGGRDWVIIRGTRGRGMVNKLWRRIRN